jgi:alkanesulfonate monooxygenase SsuD/methylene tetrahydromethanopterin reductase-like flavin-dependent oxidoreductase (luciferase family)
VGTAGTLPGAFTCEGGHFTLSAWLEPAATVGGNPFDYTMKFSLYIPTGTTQEFSGYTDPIAAFEKIRELAMAADDGGFGTIWAPDHFVPFGPPGAYVFEVWTTLAALARETRAIKLGQLVTGNGYRNPTLLAKMASTLDVISHGRLTFGVGAGWYEDEYRSFGYEFARPRTVAATGRGIAHHHVHVDRAVHVLRWEVLPRPERRAPARWGADPAHPGDDRRRR